MTPWISRKLLVMLIHVALEMMLMQVVGRVDRSSLALSLRGNPQYLKILSVAIFCPEAAES